ncbi:MAG: hypothetical protein B6I34_06510 [Anaerolineaceae bacterium 4572_32.1]|nr:MAG: hypothetical protein B6I34_06510 [Anaerolineaceae bacterium 4572_32.1]
MAKAQRNRRVRRKKTALKRQVPTSTVVQAEPISFAEEYQYVIADLKRIFVLAAGMLALLVVLALVF